MMPGWSRARSRARDPAPSGSASGAAPRRGFAAQTTRSPGTRRSTRTWRGGGGRVVRGRKGRPTPMSTRLVGVRKGEGPGEGEGGCSARLNCL